MSFRTTCSHCKSIFNITEQQLSAADGWAQCSVCALPFDALAGLPEQELEKYLAEIEARQAALRKEQEAEAVRQAAGEGSDGAESSGDEGGQAAASSLTGLERRMSEHVAEEQGESLDLPSIIIIDPDEKVSDDHGPMPEIPSSTEPEKREYASEEETDDDGDDFDEDESGQTVADTKASYPQVARTKPSEANFSLAGQQKKQMPGWQRAAILVLALVLVGQLAYYLREPIVARYPDLRPAYASLCETLGCSMGLPQNIDKIKILGSDLQSEPGNSKKLTLALTLANQADYAQSWPMLQLTLTDTKDTAVARRVFAPSEYLSRPGMQDTGIPPLSETPLNLHLDAKGSSASGFRVEVFY